MRRMLLAASVAAAFLLTAASALAAPITIATPFTSGPPSVAVRSDGTAIIAWANTKDLNGAKNFVQWCVLPVGATACAPLGEFDPAGGAQFIDDVQVLDEGSTVVILAEVYGASSTNFEYVQEWQSTDGGKTFSLVNGGTAVATGDPSADSSAIGGVTLPGGGSIGMAFQTAPAAPTFHALSLAAPSSCTRTANGCPDGYATLEPPTNPDVISNAGGNFAANTSGVMGVFNTNFTNGPLGCSNALTVPFGTAYVFGSGLPSAANNYNVSPGQPNTAWRNAFTQLDCNVDYPAVGAGPSGFGVLEQNELTKTTIYHRFDQGTQSFDIAPVQVSAQGEQQPSVSQDGAGGIYATYLSGGAGGPVSLSYSADGGTTWSGPNTLSANTSTGIANTTSNVNAAGQGWAAWDDNGSVFAEPFQASDSVAPPAATALTTIQTAGAQTGQSISVPAGTIGMTDRATITGANAAHATGTIVYTLYSSASCAPTNVVSTGGALAVNGAQAPASAPITTGLAPGTYYWRAAYSGNAGSAQGALGNAPATSACDEVLTVTAPNAISGQATSNGQSVTFGASCAVVPCTLKATLTTATGKATAAAKHKPKILGRGTFHITKKGTRKLTLKLSKTGRRYLAKKRGKVKLSLSVSEKVGGRTVATKRTLTVKVSHPKHKKKKK